MSGDLIHVVASSDEGYAPHLGVMFLSLLKNTKVPSHVRLYVLDGGIREGTKEEIEGLVRRFDARVTWVGIEEQYAEFPTEKWLTRAAYFRLSIPELLDPEIEKALYLDCDMIVRDDIAEIWAVDVRGYSLGAVENISDRTYKRAGVSQSEYFNSGVMLLNLAQWRRERVADRVRAQLTGDDAVCTNDQDALNRVLHGSWKRLALRWNFQSGMYRPHRQLEKYEQKEIDDALFDPAIIHFVGWSKPWKYLSYHPLQRIYVAYRDQTIWATDVREGFNWRNRLRRVFSPSLLKKRARQLQWERRYRDRGWSEV